MKNKSVDVNIQDLDGHTALHWAADKGSSDIVKALLSSSNIRINTQNHEDGYCPLSIAVGGGFKDVVAILVEDERTDLNVSVMQCNVCLLLYFVIFSFELGQRRFHRPPHGCQRDLWKFRRRREEKEERHS